MATGTFGWNTYMAPYMAPQPYFQPFYQVQQTQQHCETENSDQDQYGSLWYLGQRCKVYSDISGNTGPESEIRYYGALKNDDTYSDKWFLSKYTRAMAMKQMKSQNLGHSEDYLEFLRNSTGPEQEALRLKRVAESKC